MTIPSPATESNVFCSRGESVSFIPQSWGDRRFRQRAGKGELDDLDLFVLDAFDGFDLDVLDRCGEIRIRLEILPEAADAHHLGAALPDRRALDDEALRRFERQFGEPDRSEERRVGKEG